jgi:hypothetical protein
LPPSHGNRFIQRLTAPRWRDGSEPDDATIHRAAEQGVATPSRDLPFADRIQAAFGGHDLSDVRAHTGSEATASAHAMGAAAFATGNHVVFAGTPDLRTAAHEAAHIVQQRAGVQLADGIGRDGDAYECQADAAAARVVGGGGALGLFPSATGVGAPGMVQRFTLNGGTKKIPPNQPKGIEALWGWAVEHDERDFESVKKAEDFYRDVSDRTFNIHEIKIETTEWGDDAELFDNFVDNNKLVTLPELIVFLVDGDFSPEFGPIFAAFCDAFAKRQAKESEKTEKANDEAEKKKQAELKATQNKLNQLAATTQQQAQAELSAWRLPLLPGASTNLRAALKKAEIGPYSENLVFDGKLSEDELIQLRGDWLGLDAVQTAHVNNFHTAPAAKKPVVGDKIRGNKRVGYLNLLCNVVGVVGGRIYTINIHVYPV